MSYEDRFVKRAAAAGPAFARAVKGYLGFAPADAAALLDIAGKLSQPSGARMSDSDIQTFARLHPQLPQGGAAEVARRINALPPHRRGDTFLAVLSGGGPALYGDHVDASRDFKQLQALSAAYTEADYVDRINAKLKGTDAAPPWRPEPGSVRDLVERAVTPIEQRRVRQTFEAGNPDTEDFMRDRTADRMQASIEALQQPEASTRELLSAAYDMHDAADFARDELGVTGE